MVRCEYGFSFWLFFFLQSYLLGLLERYPEIFDGGGIDGQQPGGTHQINFARKWKGYQSIAILANGDITKFSQITSRPLEECLLYLCYLSDKNTMEQAIHRATMNKYKR